MLWPPVSVRIVTYKREKILGGALLCYLNLKYEGKKELVILNDDPNVELVYDHPEVRIINNPFRWERLSDKINRVMELCKYDLVLPMGDDDQIAPHSLISTVTAKQECGKGYVEFTPFLKSTKLIKYVRACAGIHMVEKQLWFDLGGMQRDNYSSITWAAGESGNKAYAKLKSPYFWWTTANGFEMRHTWVNNNKDSWVANTNRNPRQCVLVPKIAHPYSNPFHVKPL